MPQEPTLAPSDVAAPPRATHPLALAPVAAPASTVDGFVREFLQNLNFNRGVALSTSSATDRYYALAYTVRDYLMARWLEDGRRQREVQAKGVCYLSAEYLLGRQLDNNLLASGLTKIAEDALTACGIDLDELRQEEVEPGLGNGGLGRLAACFIDSLATMGVPNTGYGIRYEYGIFRQTFVDGQQVEQPDAWLAYGSPWEFPHPEAAQTISFGGHTEKYVDGGVTRSRWIPAWSVQAVPYNYMVPGYQNGRVNTLRLWSAKATDSFDLRVFNSGDYEEAVRAQTYAENISKVLYPEDSTPQGKELRLQQQYFFVAASIKDFLEVTLPKDFDLTKLPSRIIFQLNDTHPVIAVPELMRVLVDEKEHGVGGRVGDHPAVLRVHVPHPAARSPRGVVGRAARTPAAAPPRDHLPHQRRLLGCRPRALRRRRDAHSRHVDHRRAPGALGAHGVPRDRRRREGQRRRRAALAAAARQGAARLQRVLPRQVHERHQRRDAPPLRAAGEPVAVGAHHRRARLGLGHRPRAAARARVPRRRPGVPRPLRRGQGRQQAAPERGAARARRLRGQRRPHARRDGQAPARVQAADAQGAAHRDAVREHRVGPGRGIRYSAAHGRSSARRPRRATRWPSTSST